MAPDDDLQVEPSVRELVSTAVDEASTMISAQVELAKAEIRESAQNAARAFGMLAVAGVFAFLGFIFLLVTVAYVLVQLGLPIWAGFGIVTAFLFLVGLLLALVGKSKANKVKGPEHTMEQIEATKQAFATPE